MRRNKPQQQQSTTRRNMAQQGTARHNKAQQGTTGTTGTARHSKAQEGTTRYNMAQQHGTTSTATQQHNRVQQDTKVQKAQQGTTTRHNKAQQGTRRHNKVQHGARHNKVPQGTTRRNKAQQGTAGIARHNNNTVAEAAEEFQMACMLAGMVCECIPFFIGVQQWANVCMWLCWFQTTRHSTRHACLLASMDAHKFLVGSAGWCVMNEIYT